MSGSIPHPQDPSQEVRVPVEGLRDFIIRVLVKKSVFQFDAQVVADRMLEADLHGLPSHGVTLLPYCVQMMDLGDLDPRGRVLVERESAAVATLDGSRALGQVAATKAMELAIKKAQDVGTGTVAVHHSQHLGAASVYTRLAAKAGLIGFCTSSTGGATVSAPGTSHPAVANNPWSWAIPTGDGTPIVVDFSAGAASWGKLQTLAAYGLPLPVDIMLDETGRRTDELSQAKTLRPAAAGRGFGLALVASLLSGGLAGGKQPLQKTRSASSECSEHLLMAIDIGQFTDRDKFLQRAAEAATAIRSLPPEDGGAPVRLPGDRGRALELVYRETGVPLHQSVIVALTAVGQKLKLQLPWAAPA
jgi:LDH2 family malate/lactate/ureidoglycolate dehydrogenase